MAKRARPPIQISGWYHLFEGLQASAQGFYAEVEAAIDRRQIPGVQTMRVDMKEHGLFSARREYLRVRRQRYVFDICGAPFGPSFFVSWRMGLLHYRIFNFLLYVPLVNLFVIRFLGPRTYYEIDAMKMFEESIGNAVGEVVDAMSSAKGLRLLSVLERKPVMRGLFNR